MSPRLLAPLVALAAALAGGSSAWALGADGGIELAKGSGRAVLTLRGAALGSLERGRITIAIRAGEPQVLVQGEDWQRRTADGVTYGGRDIRFRIFRGAWRLVIQGGGISASAVGEGLVGLRGTGRYSIDGASYKPWPAEYQTIKLGYDR
jgi:hypothetical protein